MTVASAGMFEIGSSNSNLNTQTIDDETDLQVTQLKCDSVSQPRLDKHPGLTS